MKKLAFTGLILLMFFSLSAQQQRGMMQQGDFSLKPGTGMVVGKVTDINGEPMQYTTVSIYKLSDSTVVSGTLTDTSGKFMLKDIPYGEYYLQAKFIGFRKKTITGIKVSPQNRMVKIGKIVLKEDATELDQVVVTAQKQDVEYKVDKKVINVSQNTVSQGGSAIDVLENVPSIEVDIEGNVSIRGSSNFQVLINGKPSVLEGSEALQQIPASEIEKIEIITNPSAKYDPDGVGGIINIITKTPKEKGYNGNITFSYDNHGSLKANAIFNIRHKKFNFFAGFDINNGKRPADYISNREIIGSTSSFITESEGLMDMNRGGWKAKTGFNYYLNDNNTITFTAHIGQRAFNMYNNSSVTQTLQATDGTILSQTNLLQSSYTTARGPLYQFDMDWEHKFNDKGHKIQAMAYASNWMPLRETGLTQDTTDAQGNILDLYTYTEKSTELKNGFKGRLQIDYTLPLNNGKQIEAGYTARILDMSSDYHMYRDEGSGLVEDTLLAKNYRMLRNIQAGYITYSGKLAGFGYQLGLRTEYIYRTIGTIDNPTQYTYTKTDFFPTMHISRMFGGKYQMQLGYSRRVNRPRGWNLYPSVTYIDRYTTQVGNPELKPEYTDALEFNNILYLGKSSTLSLETFYRQTTNKFQRIMTVTDANSVLYTWTNAGKDQSMGAELSFNGRFLKMFMLNASTSAYQYTLDGEIDGEAVSKETFTWNSRIMLMTMFPTGTRLQLTGFYTAPTVTLQGSREAMYFTSIGIRQDLFKRKLSVTLSIRDPFKTSKFAFTNQTDDLISYTEYQMLSPTYSLTLSWRINDYKSKRNGQRNQDDISDFEGEGMY